MNFEIPKERCLRLASLGNDYDIAAGGITSIPPHQQRVIDEKAELDERAKKLSAFIGENPIFEKLDAEEQERMKVQNDLMWQLSEVLGARIAAFSPVTP